MVIMLLKSRTSAQSILDLLDIKGSWHYQQTIQHTVHVSRGATLFSSLISQLLVALVHFIFK